MKEYGWDWHTYLSQPSWLLDLAVQKYVIEQKLADQELKKNQAHG